MTYWAKYLAVFALVSEAVELRYDEMVMFPDGSVAPVVALAEFGQIRARLLNPGDGVRKVARITTPPGWKLGLPGARDYTLELFVLDGTLEWQGTPLATHDYAFLPATAPSPVLSTPRGARLLLFFDPPRSTDGDAAQPVRTGSLPWRGGSVAQRDTGTKLALDVKDLRKVESTGQRTWLLRAGTDLDVPWERHSTVEEGYLVSGDYRLVECLASGAQASDYKPGGYFYRPPGIVHSGPDSGARSEVLWLLRSPSRLDVEFLPDCKESAS